MKRLTALMLALVMMLSLLAGCSKDEETTTAAPTTAASGETTTAAGEVESDEPYGVFHNYLISDVDTINPHIYTMSDSGTIFGLISMGLYRYVPNETGDGFIFTTDLAESDTQQMYDEGKFHKHLGPRKSDGRVVPPGEKRSSHELPYSCWTYRFPHPPDIRNPGNSRGLPADPAEQSMPSFRSM